MQFRSSSDIVPAQVTQRTSSGATHSGEQSPLVPAAEPKSSLRGWSAAFTASTKPSWKAACSLLLTGIAVYFATSTYAAVPGDKPAADDYRPAIAAASDEGQSAIERFRVPEGTKLTLWAAEPLLANPVAFCLDEQGRVYVAETFRQQRGVEDNRSHMDWLDDDLAAMTVEDRLAYLKKNLGDKINEYSVEQDRIRLLEDKDGDGTADSSLVFAGGFNGILEGTGAGVLARNGTVWYTNIPGLWSLRDTDGDSVADVREELQTGYGVRYAFRGHDMHGLRFGPDGRLYFSIGDRGLNVVSKEGVRYVYPDQGAVLRCEPDGSALEVFATGLRNPQELAFDQFGNLFTGDNNSDSGDRARWVYVMEGGETGWRMSYQYLSDRGPWNREKLWHTAHPGQAAYVVPPLLHLGDGPSGLAFYPGQGLPAKYDNHFFLCDFRGTPANSGVRSFALQPRGAGYEVIDSQEFLWSILVTDVDFAPDGGMYVSDWVEGWNGPGKGRMYRLASTDQDIAAQTLAVKKLIANGFTSTPLETLAKLLQHPHQQVRQAVQFELANRGEVSIDTLDRVLTGEDQPQLTRVHAIWALGQIARHVPASRERVIKSIRWGLSVGDDEQLRAQAARVLGDVRDTGSSSELVKLLAQPVALVQREVCLSLAKVGNASCLTAVLDLLETTGESDPHLRHAAIMALTGSQSAEALAGVLKTGGVHSRVAATVALRRQNNPAIVAGLHDVDPRVVDEAARAINDLPMNDLMPALAEIADRTGLTESTLYRSINANYRLGTAENAARIANMAGNEYLPEAIRVEALNALADWQAPSGRDRVMGLWRPLEKRDPAPAKTALVRQLGKIFGGSEPIQQAATAAGVKLQIPEIAPQLARLAVATDESVETRMSALRGLDSLKSELLLSALESARTAGEAPLRAVALSLLAKRNGTAAVPELRTVALGGEVVERQAATAALAELAAAEADTVLAELIAACANGTLPKGVLLELQEAIVKRNQPSLSSAWDAWKAANPPADKLQEYAASLEGGNASRGKQIFFERGEASCVRCHKIADRGGEVGPALTNIGGKHPRDYLLQAIVDPNAKIAEGFETVLLELDTGKVVSGILKSETETSIELMNADGGRITIMKSSIEERGKGISGMPEDIIKKITPRDIRDLVEYLSTQK